MSYFLIRSPLSVVKKGFVGYGRKKVNFSEFTNSKDVIEAINLRYESGIGRNTNNVTRFFNLKAGDIVIVPLTKSFAIGKVVGDKFFDETYADEMACNLVRVEFLQVNGHVLRIARSQLSTVLQTRLRIRTAVASLQKFKAEIDKIIEDVENNGAYKQDSYYIGQVAEAIDNFKKKILFSIKKGETGLEAGGKGLEHLIEELLKLNGYSTNIEAKNKTSDKSDVDIIATKTDRFIESNLLIQVKHHSGFTNHTGIDQLILWKNDDKINYDKWLFTSGQISDDNQTYAENNNIKLMDGDELAEWIYENVERLSIKFKQQLGIIEIPYVIEKF